MLAQLQMNAGHRELVVLGQGLSDRMWDCLYTSLDSVSKGTFSIMPRKEPQIFQPIDSLLTD